MRVSTRQYAQALLTLGEGLDTTQASVVAKRFFTWLSRRGEKKKLMDILREADRLSREREGRVDVSMVTAFGIDEATQAMVSQQASTMFPGKTLIMKYRTDEQLIGGFIIQSDEVFYDTSLVTAMKKMRATLIG